MSLSHESRNGQEQSLQCHNEERTEGGINDDRALEKNELVELKNSKDIRSEQPEESRRIDEEEEEDCEWIKGLELLKSQSSSPEKNFNTTPSKNEMMLTMMLMDIATNDEEDEIFQDLVPFDNPHLTSSVTSFNPQATPNSATTTSNSIFPNSSIMSLDHLPSATNNENRCNYPSNHSSSSSLLSHTPGAHAPITETYLPTTHGIIRITYPTTFLQARKGDQQMNLSLHHHHQQQEQHHMHQNGIFTNSHLPDPDEIANIVQQHFAHQHHAAAVPSNDYPPHPHGHSHLQQGRLSSSSSHSSFYSHQSSSSQLHHHRHVASSTHLPLSSYSSTSTNPSAPTSSSSSSPFFELLPSMSTDSMVSRADQLQQLDYSLLLIDSDSSEDAAEENSQRVHDHPYRVGSTQNRMHEQNETSSTTKKRTKNQRRYCSHKKHKRNSNKKTKTARKASTSSSFHRQNYQNDYQSNDQRESSKRKKRRSSLTLDAEDSEEFLPSESEEDDHDDQDEDSSDNGSDGPRDYQHHQLQKGSEENEKEAAENSQDDDSEDDEDLSMYSGEEKRSKRRKRSQKPRKKAPAYARNILMDWLVEHEGKKSDFSR